MDRLVNGNIGQTYSQDLHAKNHLLHIALL